MTDKIEQLSRSNFEIREECKKLEYEVLSKAEKDSLYMLESKFREFTPLEDYHTLKDQVMTCVTRKEISKIEEIIYRCEKAMERLKELDSITQIIKEVKSELEGSILNCVKKSELETQVLKTDKKIMKITTDMSLVHNSIAKSDQALRKLESMVLNRVTVSDFNYKTNHIINSYAKLTDLTMLKSQVLPTIKDFETRIDGFQKLIEENQKIISRFDEVLCEKSSKIEVEEVRKQLKEYVKLQEFEKINEFKDSVVEDLDLMYLRITDIHKEINGDLNEMITKASSEIKVQILHSLGGKPVDVNELKNLMELKVDKSEFKKQESLMVNKKEVLGLSSSIEMVRTQLKNITTIICDHIENSLDMKVNSKTGKLENG